jgi:hypothetical protein
LVQNIAVNGWGYTLSIRDSNPSVVNEAALMTQLSTLHTVYDVLGADEKEKVGEIFALYNEFLDNPDFSYFYQYLANTNLIDECLETLNAIKQAKPSVEHIGEDLQLKAKAMLFSMFSEDAFNNHANGYTYQALSVFVESASIGGCKSGNERAQAVNGRVAILDFLSIERNTREQLLDVYLGEDEAKRIKSACQELQRAMDDKDTSALPNAIDVLYESLNLEGFQSVVSLMDQGGHSKLQSQGGLLPDTNKAETITNHAKHASKWQCHKGLTDNMLKEFCGVEKFNTKNAMIKSARNGLVLSGVGALICLAIPPLGIGIIIGASLGVVAGVMLGVVSALPSLWRSSGYATNKRFEKIVNENRTIKENSINNLVSGQSNQEPVVPSSYSRLADRLESTRRAMNISHDDAIVGLKSVSSTRLFDTHTVDTGDEKEDAAKPGRGRSNTI